MQPANIWDTHSGESWVLAEVMPLNCNSFRFVLRRLAIYLVSWPFSTPHTTLPPRRVSCASRVILPHPWVLVCTLCHLPGLLPLICVVYLTQMPHKNKSNNIRPSFMQKQEHTHIQGRTRAAVVLCINVKRHHELTHMQQLSGVAGA